MGGGKRSEGLYLLVKDGSESLKNVDNEGNNGLMDLHNVGMTKKTDSYVASKIRSY